MVVKHEHCTKKSSYMATFERKKSPGDNGYNNTMWKDEEFRQKHNRERMGFTGIWTYWCQRKG